MSLAAQMKEPFLATCCYKAKFKEQLPLKSNFLFRKQPQWH
jgi:hypothetical protein